MVLRFAAGSLVQKVIARDTHHNSAPQPYLVASNSQSRLGSSLRFFLPPADRPSHFGTSSGASFAVFFPKTTPLFSISSGAKCTLTPRSPRCLNEPRQTGFQRIEESSPQPY